MKSKTKQLTEFQRNKKRIDAEIIREFKSRQGNVTVIYAEVSAFMRAKGDRVSPSRVQRIIDEAKKNHKI